MSEAGLDRIPWRSIQVRYYDPDKDGLVLDCVQPLFRRLDGVAHEPYFVRHWRQGPHLRLNFRSTPDAWANEVLPQATATLTRYLRRRPSTARLDGGALLEPHRRLAIREAETGPLWPWYPDNSIQTEPYDDRRRILGGQRLADLVDAFHAESTRMAFTTMERICSGELTLLRVALDLMVAFAHVSVPPISRGYLSFRSHAAGFASQCEDRDGVVAGFDATYRQNARQLRAMVLAQVEAVDGTRTAPHVRDWIAFVHRQKEIARPLLARNEIDLDAAPRDPRQRQLHKVDFHQVLLSTDRHRTQILSSAWFRAHRLTINMLYAHLARLGITPIQRYLFCHLIACAVEEEYGISPMEKAREFVASTAGPAGVDARHTGVA